MRGKVQRVNSINQQLLLEEHPYIQEENISLVLTFHPAVYIIFNILKSAHRIIGNSPTLKAILPKPLRGTFCNPKTLHDKFVHSKLRADYEEKEVLFLFLAQVTVTYATSWNHGMNLKVQPLLNYIK